MNVSRRRFWIATAAAALGIAITLALGYWQLGRGLQRQALQERIESRRAQPPLPASALLDGAPQDLLDHPVVLKGRWSRAHTVFLENRQMRGQPGFYVVTPLLLAGTDRAVLVQRGWAPRNFLDRAQLPTIDTPQGIVEVRGRIAPPPAKLYELGNATAGPIRQNLDLAAFAAETGLALLGVSVQETGPDASGLQRAWPEVGSGAAKNFGYAAQWWALSALIAVLYVWFQYIAPKRHAR